MTDQKSMPAAKLRTLVHRLTALAEFLQKLPPKRFNYSHWVGDDWDGKQDLSCGTTACALGWAPSVPALKRCGLRLVRSGDNFWGAVGAVTICANVQGYEDANDLSREAAMATFNLTEAEFDYLFTPECDCPLSESGTPVGPDITATAKQVARHILRFVGRRQKHEAKLRERAKAVA